MTTYEEVPAMSVVHRHRNLPEREILYEDDNLMLAESYENFLAVNELDERVKIPFIVRLFENPKSPVCLTGAVSLYHHDLIHCILGRGIESYDEAFVIGMTMGSVRTLKNYEIRLYKFVSRRLFPGIYNFSYEDLVYFDMGIALARSMTDIKPLDAFHPDEILYMTMREIRSELGIEMEKVNQVIFPEKQRIY
jgi:hypothetical protein